MKLYSLALFVGSLASAATVSFRANRINSLQISVAYISWQFVPNGEVEFPAKKVTHPIYDDATILEATKFDGNIDIYQAQSDVTFSPGQTLTLKGPDDFPPQPGSIIHIDDKAKGVKTEWKLLSPDESGFEELK